MRSRIEADWSILLYLLLCFSSPQFYAYRINAPTLLADRTFECPGVIGDARNQCDGNKVSLPVLDLL
jgi:hypothetical protein